MENFIWTIKNQHILQKIYNENRYKIRLEKNRIEKMRQRAYKKLN